MSHNTVWMSPVILNSRKQAFWPPRCGWKCTTTHYNSLQHTATARICAWCSTHTHAHTQPPLQHAATHRNTLQHTATHCNSTHTRMMLHAHAHIHTAPTATRTHIPRCKTPQPTWLEIRCNKLLCDMTHSNSTMTHTYMYIWAMALSQSALSWRKHENRPFGRHDVARNALWQTFLWHVSFTQCQDS